MIHHPAQGIVNIVSHCYLRNSLIERSSWLPKGIKSIPLPRRRQPTGTGRDFHILRAAVAPVNRDLEAEVTQEAGVAEEIEGIKGIEGTGEVEEVGVGSIGRKKSGAQNGRMSFRLPPHFHSD